MNVGGIENMLMQIYRNIDRTKYQFDFVVHSENNVFGEEIKSMGGKIYVVPNISRAPIKHIRMFNQLLEQHPEYEIVHIHTTYAIMYFDAYIAKKWKRTLVIHSHNSCATKIHTLLHMVLKKHMSNLADYRIACSDMAGKWLFSAEDNFVIWKNAINLKHFQFDSNTRKEIRKRLGLYADDILIGNVARLSYQKNPKLLVDVYKAYEKIHPQSKLIFIGAGEERAAMEEYIASTDCKDKIILLGNKSNPNEYLMAIDIFCLTSRWEGFPVSLIEAEAAGTMLVVPDHIDEIIRQFDNVHIVNNYDNINEWVEKVNNLVPLDEECRKKRYEHVKSLGYEITQQVKVVEEFYEKICKQS